MKRRASLSLSPTVVDHADAAVAGGVARSRSAYIEDALRSHLEELHAAEARSARLRAQADARKAAAEAEAAAAAEEQPGDDGF